MMPDVELDEVREILWNYFLSEKTDQDEAARALHQWYIEHTGYNVFGEVPPIVARDRRFPHIDWRVRK